MRQSLGNIVIAIVLIVIVVVTVGAGTLIWQKGHGAPLTRSDSNTVSRLEARLSSHTIRDTKVSFTAPNDLGVVGDYSTMTKLAGRGIIVDLTVKRSDHDESVETWLDHQIALEKDCVSDCASYGNPIQAIVIAGRPGLRQAMTTAVASTAIYLALDHRTILVADAWSEDIGGPSDDSDRLLLSILNTVVVH